MCTINRHVLACLLVFAFFPPGFARAQSAQTLISDAAKAMGGMAALRALKNQAVEVEGKQFDAVFPLQFKPGRQISSFRYTLTRDLVQPRMKLEWEARHLTRNEDIRFIEVIDGTVGLLQEGSGSAAKQSRLHPGRLATRLRDEKRAAAKLILLAAAQKSLRRQSDLDVDGVKNRVLSYKNGADEFRIYLDAKTSLPTQADILDSDPLEDDTSYLLRYGDWRKVDGIVMPFNLRNEINGRPFQEEQIKSIRHNGAIAPEAFSIPEPIRNQTPDAAPVASQWILRRVAGNVSYQDFGRAANIEWLKLADGVHKVAGGSHATIVIEMRDHLVAVEGPLYEARTAPVVQSIKERFPGKPIRYVVPTHHHLDHSGGIRAFMAEGAAMLVPFAAKDFYTRVAKAPHTRQPDSLERNRRTVVIEAFGGAPRVLTDGSRRVEVHPLPTSHAEDIVVIYLPADKMAIEADHISPRGGQVRPAPLVKEFVAGLDKLAIDVATIVGIHGDSASMQATRAAAQGGKK
jgi:glyoxylase-like metal-dependent hydrolase (beta-lactamase superfamily II)